MYFCMVIFDVCFHYHIFCDYYHIFSTRMYNVIISNISKSFVFFHLIVWFILYICVWSYSGSTHSPVGMWVNFLDVCLTVFNSVIYYVFLCLIISTASNQATVGMWKNIITVSHVSSHIYTFTLSIILCDLFLQLSCLVILMLRVCCLRLLCISATSRRYVSYVEWTLFILIVLVWNIIVFDFPSLF